MKKNKKNNILSIKQMHHHIKSNSYTLYQNLPAFKLVSEQYMYDPAKFYNHINNYNTSNCSSYIVQNYQSIKPDALTHGGLLPKYGHFNIMDAYNRGGNSASCDFIGTKQN